MVKIPKTKHAKVKPDNRYKGLLQVGLTNADELRNALITDGLVCTTHLVSCVRTLLRTVLKAEPIGAPAEKVAKATEREGPGGNALDKIPS